jgi:hypothetical protein
MVIVLGVVSGLQTAAALNWLERPRVPRMAQAFGSACEECC